MTKVYTKSYSTLYAHDIFVSFSASEMVNKTAFLSRFFFPFSGQNVHGPNHGLNHGLADAL